MLMMLNALLPGIDNRAYDLMPNDEFDEIMKTDSRRANRIYWREMLSRSHWAASLCMVRSHRWMVGVVSGYEAKNLMHFSACLRGFIESSADANDSLNPIAATIADNHHIIMKAVHGDLHDVYQSKELEDRLIHFTHARRTSKGDDAPETHKAKTGSEYMAKVQVDAPEVKDLYARLCDITHPGATSVLSYSAWNEDGTSVYFLPSREAYVIDEIVQGSKRSIPVVAALGITPSLAVLKVLNEMRVPGLRTTALNQVRFDGMPAWEDIKRSLRR